MRSFGWLVPATAGLVIVALMTPAGAQTARTGGAASAQLLQQMQQLASERTSLQAENSRMKKEMEDLRKERDSLKNAQKAVDSHVKASAAALAQSTAQRESTEQELKKARDQLQELIAKFRETALTLREVETDRTAARQTLTTREQDLKVCIDHNVALYKLNEEVLTRLEHQSVWSHVASAEPFTKIKRVQLENLVDDYKSRADEQRLKSASPPQPAPAEGTAAPAPVGPAPTPTASAPAPAPTAAPVQGGPPRR